MADYYTLIRQAVQRSDSRTSESRRAIYERARTALLRQLRGHDPPLSDGEITRQRLSLEDAIRKVETEMAQATLRDGATALGREPRPAEPPSPPVAAREAALPPPPPPPPRARPEPTRREPPAAAEPEPRGAPREAASQRTARTPRPRPSEGGEREAREPVPQRPARPPQQQRPTQPNPLKERLPPAARTGGSMAAYGAASATAEARRPEPAEEESNVLQPRFGRGYADPRDPDPDPEPQANRIEDEDEYDDDDYDDDDEDADDETSERRMGSTGFMIGGVVVVLAVLGFAFWQRDSVTRMFAGTSEVAAVDANIAGTGGNENGDETGAEETAGETKNEDRVPQPGVTGTPDSPVPDAEAGTLKTLSTDGTDVAAASPTPPADATVAPGHRSVLYEEGNPGEGGFAYNGTVTWSTEKDESTPGALLVRGLVDIPQRNLKLLLTMRRNADANLPASHIIELLFEVPTTFTAVGIANVPGILMKANEPTKGTALSGAAKRATDNYFLIGLSATATDQERNMELLRSRGWIDVPILYSNKKRAILTVEKGTEGERIFSEAFASWTSQ